MATAGPPPLFMLSIYRKRYDFRQLSTLSESYDRDRSKYYRAIQSVRQQDLDLVEWPESGRRQPLKTCAGARIGSAVFLPDR